MSSLAAARADNYYYAPGFDPKKKGRDSVNALAGSHPLGVRAKRLKSEGILVIRFEMPYDAWCNGCGAHVARGVRFNADKSKAGAYFSTPIYRFAMKCPQCPTQFVIQTNPQAGDYDYLEGCRKQVKGKTVDRAAAAAALDAALQGDGAGGAGSGGAAADDGADAGAGSSAALSLAVAKHVDEDGHMLIDVDKERRRMESDPMYRVEHADADQRRAARATERLLALAERSERLYADDAGLNAAARALARAQRAEEAAKVAEGAAAGLRAGVPLADASEDDAYYAAAMMAGVDKTSSDTVKGAGSTSVLSSDVRRRLLSAPALPVQPATSSSSSSSALVRYQPPHSSGGSAARATPSISGNHSSSGSGKGGISAAIQLGLQRTADKAAAQAARAVASSRVAALRVGAGAASSAVSSTTAAAVRTSIQPHVRLGAVALRGRGSGSSSGGLMPAVGVKRPRSTEGEGGEGEENGHTDASQPKRVAR